MKRLSMLVRSLIIPLVIFLTHAVPSQAALLFNETVVDPGTLTDPWGKGIGDLNGDGLTDLIVGAYSGGGLVWFQNPTWTKHQISTGSHSTDVETGDIDNDGDLDVVAVTNNSIRWYQNSNNGSSWNAYTIASLTMHDVELADLNLDGKLDVITRNQYGATSVYVYLQGTNQSFTQQSRNDLPPGEGLLVHDLDNDGDPDIIWNEVWVENTGGVVSSWPTHRYVSSWNPDVFIAVCDVNQDGLNDIILSPSESAGGTGKISYFRSPPDPKTTGWTEIIVAANVETVHHYVGCADFDRDGDIDIAAAEMQQGSDPDEVKIYENQGDHTTFTKTVISTGGSHSMRIVDIDNDGDPDLFGANWSGAQPVKLWVNQSTPPKLPITSWTYIKADNSRSQHKFGLWAGDLTGDNLLDIVSGQYFYKNPGSEMTGTWSRTTLPQASLDALMIVDVDNDSYGDVIAMNSTGEVYWLETANSQGSSWSQTLIGSVGAADEGISSQGYALADLIPGGKPEIIINVPSRLSYFTIPPNPSAGNWPNTVITTIISSEPEGVAVGDIDRDGDIDVATVHNLTQYSWWANPGSGGTTWTQHNLGTLPSGGMGDRAALTDLNGDGILDLVVTSANSSADGVYWFQGPSNPLTTTNWTRRTLLSATTNPAVDTMNSMDVADIDRDGDPDIIAAEHRGGKRMFILENTGSGSFTTHVISSGIENHLGARLFDLDQDGDLDIIGIAWDSYQDLHIWRNDAISGGVLPPPTPPGPTATPGPSPTPLPTIAAGSSLLAYYPFEEGFSDQTADLTGNHNPAVLTQTTWVSGHSGTGLEFNGSTAYGDLGNWNITGSQLTIAAWIKPASFTATYRDNRIISKASGSSESGHVWMLGTFGSGSNTTLRVRLKTNGTTKTLVADTGNINLNQWHHAAATYNGSQLILYLDGVAIGTQAVSGAISSSDDAIYLGANPPDLYAAWHGSLDELAIYQLALSQTQIQDLMVNGPQLTQPGDTDNDGDVDFLDFLKLITIFGSSSPQYGDFNQNERIDIFDLNTLIKNI